MDSCFAKICDVKLLPLNLLSKFSQSLFQLRILFLKFASLCDLSLDSIIKVPYLFRELIVLSSNTIQFFFAGTPSGSTKTCFAPKPGDLLIPLSNSLLEIMAVSNHALQCFLESL